MYFLVDLYPNASYKLLLYIYIYFYLMFYCGAFNNVTHGSVETLYVSVKYWTELNKMVTTIESQRDGFQYSWPFYSYHTEWRPGTWSIYPYPSMLLDWKWGQCQRSNTEEFG